MCCNHIKPVPSKPEVEVIEVPFDYRIPIIPETDIDLLKEKVACDYLKIITQLELGEHPDLELLLEEISNIELESIITDREFITQYYLNQYEY